MKKISFPFYITIISLFIAVISPALLSNGMFMDGLIYATISKNLANNLGSFWYPRVTETLFGSNFHEHPPLAFGIQSIFFRIFGDDTILVEKIYSFMTFFITGIIIVLIWKKITSNVYKSISWLPILFWVSIPLVSWASTNNMLENTMMIFVGLSVLFIIKSIEKQRIPYLFLSGLMLFLGFLTKGFVALFPWSLPFWIWLIKRNISFKRCIADTLILISATVIPFIFIYLLNYKGIESLIMYLNTQVVRSIQQVQTVDYRLWIIWRLFNELIPAIIIVFIAFVIGKIKKFSFKNTKENYNWILVFFSLGLSGVVPIMVSMKQSGYYMLATFPFFGIALALFIAPIVSQLINKINTEKRGFKIFKGISYVMLIVSLAVAFSQMRRFGRDKDKLGDVFSIIKIVPHNTVISIPLTLYEDWALHGYFGRYANISMDPNENISHNYLLIPKSDNKKVSEDWEKVELNLKMFDLYMLKLTNREKF